MKKLILFFSILLSTTLLQAQPYPNKPVKIVLSVGVGSAPDVVARKVAEVLSGQWKVPVIVDNRPGGAGVIGLNYINSEPADGYTIGFLEGGTVNSYQTLYNNPLPISKLEPVVPVVDASMLLVVSSQITSWKELQDMIVKNPIYGSWNIGSIGHLLGAQLVAGFTQQGTHVPYKDFGQWQSDIANKQILFGFGSFGTTKGLVNAGKNQWMAIASTKRDPRYPNIPTVKELTGQDVFTFNAWVAAYVSKETPDSIKAKIEQDIKAALKDRRVVETIATLDMISLADMSRKDFEKKASDDLKKNQQLVDRFQIKVSN